MCSGGAKYVSAHGHNIPDLLEAILKLVPLDTYNFSKYMILFSMALDYFEKVLRIFEFENDIE